MSDLDSDHLALLKKRVYDMAACTDKDVTVMLDKKRIAEKSFEK